MHAPFASICLSRSIELDVGTDLVATVGRPLAEQRSAIHIMVQGAWVGWIYPTNDSSKFVIPPRIIESTKSTTLFATIEDSPKYLSTASLKETARSLEFLWYLLGFDSAGSCLLTLKLELRVSPDLVVGRHIETSNCAAQVLCSDEAVRRRCQLLLCAPQMRRTSSSLGDGVGHQESPVPSKFISTLKSSEPLAGVGQVDPSCPLLGGP